MSGNLLEIVDLHVKAGEKEILKGLSLSIPFNEIHAIMGPNGAGKSVLSNVLSGKEDYQITSGKIIFKNENITELQPNEISNLGLFMAFQYPVEIPGVTLMNFLKTIHEANRKANGLEVLGPSDFLKYVREKAGILGINDEVLKRQLNVGFSGGEKKRFEILQMAMLKPTVSILDETDSGLDVDALKIVSDGVNAQRNNDNAIVVITHYQRLLDYIVPDFVHILSAGVIIKSGGPELALEVEKNGYSGLINAA